MSCCADFTVTSSSAAKAAHRPERKAPRRSLLPARRRSSRLDSPRHPSQVANSRRTKISVVSFRRQRLSSIGPRCYGGLSIQIGCVDKVPAKHTPTRLASLHTQLFSSNFTRRQSTRAPPLSPLGPLDLGRTTHRNHDAWSWPSPALYRDLLSILKHSLISHQSAATRPLRSAPPGCLPGESVTTTLLLCLGTHE